MKRYRIRNKASGLYSRGGTYSYRLWSKVGKIWTKATLAQHLALVRQRNCNPYIDRKTQQHCQLEIVEYELTEVGTKDLVI